MAGVMAGFFCGDVAYRRVLARSQRRVIASIASGLLTTVATSVAFIAMDVHHWFIGPEAPWTASVFLALCFGICQGVLFKDRPLLPPRPPDGSSGAAGA